MTAPPTQRPAFETVMSGLAFPEGPRWHEGALWFSDMHDGRVVRCAPGAAPETVVTLDDCPSGLGFLPDGTPLVVAMHARRVLRVDGGAVRVHADLSGIATWHANDMLVDRAGRAYVGNFGDGTAPPEPITPAALALVGPGGDVREAAAGLHLPNGMALLDGGRTLAVAETRALPPRITTFSVGPDGSLSDRRVLIELDAELPDGLTADAGGNVWFASPFTGELVRVSRAGRITARLDCPRPPYACVLAGAGAGPGAAMYVCAADDWVPEKCRAQRTGAILRVDISGL
ncbi:MULTISPECIES: SMP-30/gluconolactonase/LRE family protein [Actinomadura]|uniref:SMP-30/gluconolactonase/LRE family protein n=1 Tax=Actinomadura yumaensis TaxID=111807 RepID=A0ABW2CE83_9ACTN|nr:SMP-30/gluconolactonase/LRE family protein [Actinomadura sp. J1-007]MWK38241.1 gluconolaconase [Actinomadura sp. J1-007]